jgi:protein SCO1/2
MRRSLKVAALLAVAAAGPLRAEENARPTILREIGFDQNLGASLPLNLTFRDESGASVTLGDYFGKKPVVLNLVYFDCPMLCTVTLNGMASALNQISFDVGKEFEVVTISFDPKEGPAQAAARKKQFLARYKHPGGEAGWHFLTGDVAAIHTVTKAVGFRYVYDQASRQFAHPAGTVVLTPDGKIARYLFGVEYAPRDLRLALVEAADRKIGSPIDAVFLACYRYDPQTGRYSAAVMRMVRVAGILTVAGLGAFVLVSLRKERRRSAAGAA